MIPTSNLQTTVLPMLQLPTRTFEWLTLPLNAKYILGTPGYYDQFNGSYPTNDTLDELRIYPRDMESARHRYARLDELTLDDLVVWYHRETDEYTECDHRLVEYELNPDFNPEEPMGYQRSRVQVNLLDEVLEHTRQGLCMFCREPGFYSLWGPDCLISHFEKEHLREVPQFVKSLLRELNLSVYAPNLTPEEQIACSETHNGWRSRSEFVLRESYLIFVSDAGDVEESTACALDPTAPGEYVPVRCIKTKPPMLVLEITEKVATRHFDHGNPATKCPVFYV